MPIVPETKDWSWVIERPCPQCGYDAAALPFEQIPDLLVDNAERWPAVLSRADASIRPDDQTWSPLEYAAHVRDVHLLFAGRLRLMLDQDAPTFANWDQDAAAIEQQYSDQAPAVVAGQLIDAAAASAEAFGAVRPDQHQRIGRRGDGAVFTVVTIASYYAHEPVHHLWDVTRA